MDRCMKNHLVQHFSKPLFLYLSKVVADDLKATPEQENHCEFNPFLIILTPQKQMVLPASVSSRPQEFTRNDGADMTQGDVGCKGLYMLTGCLFVNVCIYTQAKTHQPLTLSRG